MSKINDILWRAATDLDKGADATFAQFMRMSKANEKLREDLLDLDSRAAKDAFAAVWAVEKAHTAYWRAVRDAAEKLRAMADREY